MPGWFYWLGALCLATGVLALMWFALVAFTSKGIIHRAESTATSLAALYPIGVGCKVMILGPEFFRFHLSDFGFPIFMSILWAQHATHKINKYPIAENDFVELYARIIYRFRAKRLTLVMALVASYGYELLMGLMYRLNDRATEVGLVGNFDWYDILMYTLGFLVAYRLYGVAYRRAATLHQAEKDRKEQERRIALLGRRSAAQSVTVTIRRKQSRKKNRRR